MVNQQATARAAEPAFDLRQFDEYQRMRFAKATLALFWRVARQPGGREKINAKIEEMRQEAAAAK